MLDGRISGAVPLADCFRLGKACGQTFSAGQEDEGPVD